MDDDGCMFCAEPGASLMGMPPHEPAQHIRNMNTGVEVILAPGVDWPEGVHNAEDILLALPAEQIAWRFVPTVPVG